MNNENGYIYILINPSIKGLIKVGKTTRDTDERVKELSSSTSIPTPFIVVYEMAVRNCSEAEKYVHSRLEVDGFRVNDNREFFDATITDTINIFMEYKNIEDNNHIVKENLNIERYSAPFQEIEQEADNYYLGREDFLQNYKLALTIYKKSIKLGSRTAPGKVGKMYKLGEGCKRSIETAISYFTTGVQRGDNKCYCYMMEVYLETNHIRNFLKCWVKANTLQEYVPISLIDEYLHKMIILDLSVENRELLYEIKDELIKYQKNKEDTIAKRIYGVENYKYQPLLYARYILNTPYTEKILTGRKYIGQYLDARDQERGIIKQSPIRIKGIDYIEE